LGFWGLTLPPLLCKDVHIDPADDPSVARAVAGVALAFALQVR
jgi:hypothetical protein